IAVRYTQDAFSRSGWLWPVDAKGEPLKATSYMAVGFYVAKYVNKKSDMDLAAKGLGAKEWNNSLKTKPSLLPKKLFRIKIGRAVQQECRDRHRMPSSACKKKSRHDNGEADELDTLRICFLEQR